jgi:EPS-associated MarR family transcriptional regulator
MSSVGPPGLSLRDTGWRNGRESHVARRYHRSTAVADLQENSSDRGIDMQTEIRFRVLRALEQQPDLSQRQLAELLGISLGKTNYLLRALLDKGFVKARNFRNARNKMAYAYVLTPKGLAQKAALARSYLERKTAEYESLRIEIEKLHADIGTGM